jgi:Tfp pilus assembly protein PilO
MEKSRTPQFLFVLAGLTLAAGAGGAFWQYSDLSQQKEALAELRKEARDPKDIQTELEETGAKVLEAKTQIEHLERGVPEFAYVPTMLTELEAFGKQHGIAVLGVRPIPKQEVKSKDGKAKKKKEPYQEIAIEVKGRGPYKAVHSWITALEKFPKIVGVHAVSLQPKNDPHHTGPKLLDATIEIRAFLFPPGEGEKIVLPAVAAPPASAAKPEPSVTAKASVGKAPAEKRWSRKGRVRR